MKAYTEEMSREYIRGLQEMVDAYEYLIGRTGDQFEFESGIRAGLLQAKGIALAAIKREKDAHKEWYEE